MHAAHIPADVDKAIARLNQFGYEAYCVGGCVRDILLGRRPNDWDIATSALPDQIIHCFHDETLHTYAQKYGVVCVGFERQAIEIATYRIDGNYTDNRRPTDVSFVTDIQADLARRDFTINAVAMHPKIGIIDPFRGKDDLTKKQIRCVGNPNLRFSEDALRMMRCLRFSAQLGFSIEQNTDAAIKREIHRCMLLSRERINAEFFKLLCAPKGGTVLAKYIDLLSFFIPSLASLTKISEAKKESIKFALTALDRFSGDLALRTAQFLFACLHLSRFELLNLCNKSQNGCIVESVLDELTLNRKKKAEILFLLSQPSWDDSISLHQIQMQIASVGAHTFFQCLDMQMFRSFICISEHKETQMQNFRRIRKQAQALLASGACVSLRQLALTGSDLLAAGFSPGKNIGRLLNALLDCVVSGKAKNNKECLLSLAAKWKRDETDEKSNCTH